ncbi:MAG: adenylyl-sulfate kinase [Rhodospirillales bacterium]|nr:adenylyl-sulfate kinase [Rhodospirillales bacterium]
MKTLKNNKKNTHTGFALWLMGPTSSGKTTLATLLIKRLLDENITAINYDGDEVRNFFGEGHGFTPADRLRVISTLTYLVNKATQCGVNVVVSALTANNDARKHVRDTVSNLIVGYVKCPINVCAERDPKGLYAKAHNNEINTLIGVNSEYHAPENPDIIIETDKLTPKLAVDAIVEYLHKVGHLA